MKVAILFTGIPRFCAIFNSQLAYLQNASCIDWYCSFWSTKESETFNSFSSKWTNPSWDFKTPPEAMRWLYKRLPSNHRILNLDLVSPEQFPSMPVYQATASHNLSNWGQYQILQHASHKLFNSGIEYDLVIRSRVDKGLERGINLIKCKDYLENHQHEILISKNFRHGPLDFCDQFAIGLPKTMAIYTNCVDTFSEVHLSGVPWNAELVLGFSLSRYQIKWPSTDIVLINSPHEHDNQAHWGIWV